MAIFIENSTRCPLCSTLIKSTSGAIAFPAMVWNELDPLWPITDAVVHLDCLRSHGLLEAAEARQTAVLAATGPGKRECGICRHQVTTPDEHVTLGYLTDDPASPLKGLNLAQFHRSCLGNWQGLPALIADLEAANSSGSWRGRWLGELVRQLASIPDSPPSTPRG